MKIAFFVYKLDDYSGAALQALEIAKNIPQIDFVIFNQNYENQLSWHEIRPNIEVVNLGKNYVKRILKIVQTLNKSNIKIVHFHGYFFTYMLLCVILRRKILLKTTLTGHDDFKSISRSNYGRFKILITKIITNNIVLTRVQNHINSTYINPKKILRIPNGVAIDETLNDKHASTFCYVGVVCKRKRTYEAIKYYLDHYSHEKDSKLYIVGPYNNKSQNAEIDQNYTSKCIELVKSHPDARIIFTDKISKIEVAEILRKSIALIFFSESEGMPNVILEAMSHNCVPIATSIGGVAEEIISNNKDGYIIEDFSRKIPIESLNHIIEMDSPKQNIKNFYDIKLIAERYVKLYESI